MPDRVYTYIYRDSDADEKIKKASSTFVLREFRLLDNYEVAKRIDVNFYMERINRYLR